MSVLSSLPADQLAEKVHYHVGILRMNRDDDSDEAKAALAELVRRLKAAEDALEASRLAHTRTVDAVDAGKSGVAHSIAYDASYAVRRALAVLRGDSDTEKQP